MNLKYILRVDKMTLQDVGSYILKTYSKRCHDVEDCEEFFYDYKLRWCGCGDPGVAKRAVRDFLAILYDFGKDADKNFDTAYKRKLRNLKERFGVESVYDNELLLCLAYTLDAADLAEHGSGISGAWLTREGEMFLWALNQSDMVKDATFRAEAVHYCGACI